jgi:hypothetical protein
MNLSVGIVGLPNVGKSTLFNALLKRQQAYVANFPFATIEPNVGVVPVPDERLAVLSKIVKDSFSMDHTPPQVPATVEFLDIAGLVKGASQGVGLGNKFLSHIREVSAICYVLRAFDDQNIIREGSVDPKVDLEVLQTELALADLQTLDKQKDPGNSSDKWLKKRWEIIQKLKGVLSNVSIIRETRLDEDEAKVSKELGLLSFKPTLIVLNVDEKDLPRAADIEAMFAKEAGVSHHQVVAISAKIESELSSLDDADQRRYLDDLGVKHFGLERLIKKAFFSLGLITFLTAGEKEVRAWTIRNGVNAQEAAGEIHTDFFKSFIRADVCDFDDFVKCGGWKNAREAGKVRSEGRDYIVKDGDVIEFKIGA